MHCFYFKRGLGSWWDGSVVKMPATKPNGLSSVPRTHTVRGESWLLKTVLLCSSGCWCAKHTREPGYPHCFFKGPVTPPSPPCSIHWKHSRGQWLRLKHHNSVCNWQVCLFEDTLVQIIQFRLYLEKTVLYYEWIRNNYDGRKKSVVKCCIQFLIHLFIYFLFVQS